jgi:metallo-beta-lactamase class B
MMNIVLSVLLLLTMCVGVSAQTAPEQTNGTDYLTAFPAHHVVANIYFVGTKGMAVYLVTTPQGHILINAGVEDSVPLIQQSVEQLGFKFSDVKILLISHAHFDHNAGAAKIKQLTGAKYFVMDADVSVVESGGKADFAYGNRPGLRYPPARVDRILHDGDTVQLGGTVLTAHLTPGHTRGCTTWTMKVQDNGKPLDVVIVGSPNVNPGYKLLGKPSYPQIASDYEKTFRVMRSLHCDIFLGAHGSYYNMEEKYARMNSTGTNVFIDPEGYKKYVEDREHAFRTELAKQRKGAAE